MVVSNFSKMVHIRLQLDILMRRIIINEINTIVFVGTYLADELDCSCISSNI